MVVERIEDTKAALRVTARARRAALSPEERTRAAQAVAQHFFAGVAIPDDDVVAGYWPLREEVDCQPIMMRLLADGRSVALPAVVAAEAALEWRVWEADAPLYAAGFGTLAPAALAPKTDPDIVLVPLLGFDRLGTRLGYGGGYYDRSFAGATSRARLVGLAFAAQEFDLLPRDEHDIALDAVVTETGLRQFGDTP